MVINRTASDRDITKISIDVIFTRKYMLWSINILSKRNWLEYNK